MGLEPGTSRSSASQPDALTYAPSSHVNLLTYPRTSFVLIFFSFSGITKSDLESIETTIRDVQEDLLGIFNDKSILIGHSLECDLIALKVSMVRLPGLSGVSCAERLRIFGLQSLEHQRLSIGRPTHVLQNHTRPHT